ncbi:unnamed protein product [Cunninghamella blakesleeana]
METIQPLHFDLAVHPTKDTIKLITSLLEKVIKVNETIQLTNKSTHNNSIASEFNKSNTANEQQDQQQQEQTTDNNKQLHRSTSSSSSTSSRRSSTTNIYTCFYARSIPGISIQAYLTRILKYCPCANECFLAILVYFDRMSKPALPARPVPLKIDSYNIHRLIIASVMIASKLFSDVFFTNTRYAKVGGLPVSELNVLELEFLALNNYNLFVTVEEFQYYGNQLLLHCMKEHEGNINKPMLYLDELSNQSNSTTKPIDHSNEHHHPNHHHHMNSPNAKREIIYPSEQQQFTNNNNNNNNNNNEYNTTHINDAAQNLTINKNSILTDTIMTDCDNTTTSKTTTLMKDLSRKSDEIDQHRLFKRPSSRIMNTDNNIMDSTASIQSDNSNSNNSNNNNNNIDNRNDYNNNSNNNFKSQNSSASMDQSVLPTPPGASPSTLPTNERSSK